MLLLASSGTGCSRNTALLHPWSSESFSNLIWLFVVSLVFCKRTASISLLFSHRIECHTSLDISMQSKSAILLFVVASCCPHPQTHITIWGRGYEMAGVSIASNATSGINYRHVLLTTPTANKFIFLFLKMDLLMNISISCRYIIALSIMCALVAILKKMALTICFYCHYSVIKRPSLFRLKYNWFVVRINWPQC